MKKGISFLLALTLIFTLATPAFAAAPTSDSLLTTEQVLSDLESFDFTREVTFVPLDTNTTFADKELFEFDSVEEAENFLQNFIMCLDKLDTTEARVLPQIAMAPRAASKTHNDSVMWWAPSIGDVFAWKNIAYTYRENGSKVTSMSVTDSWINHLAIGLSWTHKYGNADNVVTKNGVCTADLSATGVWLIGFAIKGFQVGAEVNDTWKKSISINI